MSDDEKGCFASRTTAEVNSGWQLALCCHNLSQPEIWGMLEDGWRVGEIHPDS